MLSDEFFPSPEGWPAEIRDKPGDRGNATQPQRDEKAREINKSAAAPFSQSPSPASRARPHQSAVDINGHQSPEAPRFRTVQK